MGFNYGLEKRKFTEEWKKLYREYKAAGMSEEDIQDIYAFDLNVFRKNRTEFQRTQPLSESSCDDGTEQDESMSALLKKFSSALSVCDKYSFQSDPRFAWIDEMENTPQNRASNRRKSIFEVLQMDVFPVNWDSVPEVMNKEQFFRICHISKSTALHLLKSGKVPCEWSGKKTRCYKIRKEDVKAYLDERAIFPELYSAPKGWYGTHYVARLSKELPEDTLRQMHGYYEKLLRKYPDVVTVKDVVTLTGYTLTTVHNWCSRGSLKAFQKGLKFCIPKIFLVDFFCSLTFRSITRKSLWHIQTLNEFSRKMKK